MIVNKILFCLILSTSYELAHLTSSDASAKTKKTTDASADQTERNFGSGSNLGNFDSVLGQFWHTLYINRGFNSSFVLIVPLFTITIPGYGRGLQNQTPLSALNLGNLAVLGIIVFGSIALWAPVLFPDFSGSADTFRQFKNFETMTETAAKSLVKVAEQTLGRALDMDETHPKANNFITKCLHSIIDLIMSLIDKLLDEIPVYPGLHPKHCIKRAICETFKRSESYGLVGRVIRFVFRPRHEKTKSGKTQSKYRLSANYGLKDKSIECVDRFTECHLNFAHLLHNVIQFLL